MSQSPPSEQVPQPNSPRESAGSKEVKSTREMEYFSLLRHIPGIYSRIRITDIAVCLRYQIRLTPLQMARKLLSFFAFQKEFVFCLRLYFPVRLPQAHSSVSSSHLPHLSLNYCSRATCAHTEKAPERLSPARTVKTNEKFQAAHLPPPATKPAAPGIQK